MVSYVSSREKNYKVKGLLHYTVMDNFLFCNFCVLLKNKLLIFIVNYKPRTILHGQEKIRGKNIC